MKREELNNNIIKQATGLKLSKESRKALERFKEAGLPHKKLENYKYTNVDKFFPESLIIESRPASLSLEQVEKASLGMESNLVFINGTLSTEHTNLPEGIEIQVTDSTSSLVEFQTDSLEDLNLALAPQIIKLRIEKDSSPKAVKALHVYTDESKGSLRASRLLIDVEQGSKFTIAELFNSSDENTYNRNHMTQIIAGKNSDVEHVKVVAEGQSSFHFGSLNAVVKEDAVFHSFTFTTGGKLTRNNINVELTGIGARGEVNGLYALKGDQHCDNFSQIHHRIERTESEQLFKAVLDDKSHGIFTGKIVVHRDAQLVNSSQLNKNLLLSKKAHADTRPQLEVYADDVKCAHGATVGQLSEEELFYLSSRGISPQDARVMLCHGFVQEALDQIKNEPIRHFLEEHLYKNFEKEVHEKILENS